MVIYNDNSCSNCGGVRAVGSTLCGFCLQTQVSKTTRDKKVLQRIIDEQDLAIGKLRVLCERLLDHIVNDRVSAARLATGMFEVWKRKELAIAGRLEMLLKCRQGLVEMVEKEAEDVKGRQAENAGK